MNLICWNMAPNTKVTRKWEVFAGRNKFYCDGYLMSAPNTGVFYLTIFLITGTSVLFFAFDCPFLTLQITPAIPVVGAFLYFFTMGSLLRTTFTDPGVIPRASHDEAAYIEKQIEVPNSLNSPTYRPPPRTKEILVKGQTVKLKYCFTCKIFRPPRASHCSLCDNCVDRFDHHCPWVGNCVGKRNYRFFYMFIVSLAFLAVFIFSCSLTHLILPKDNNKEFIEVIRQAPFSVVVTFICFFSIWSVIGLAGFHTYLTTSNQTTNEDIKGSFSSKGTQHAINPYSQGNVCLNCFYILCGPMTPSLIDRRGIVTDEYRIQMQPVDRLNNAIQAPQLITQPQINSDQITKSKYYDIEHDPHGITSGIYRQRSYENLEKGHSNSVARLVENELPISTLNSPIDDNVTSYEYEDGQLGNFNNVNGSYTNLFREKCDDTDEQEKSFKNRTETEKCEQRDLTENVYSNIPQTMLTSTSTVNRSDPNLHVYSNVAVAGSQTDFTDTVSNVSKSILDIPTGSSILLSDDLDLDDPVVAANSFGQTLKSSSSTIKSKSAPTIVASSASITTTTSTLQKSNINNTTDTLSPSSIDDNAKIVSIIDRKCDLPQMTLVDNASTTIVNGTEGNGNSKLNRSNNAFCSPSRMRLLHDTTMIDTALDLDSLDGTNLGNNSQSCLVKTAIV